MNNSQHGLDMRMLAQWERLRLDPDWDPIDSYRESDYADKEPLEDDNEK